MIIYAIYYIYYMCFIYTHIHNHIYFISKFEFSFSLLCLPALETGSGLPQPVPPAPPRLPPSEVQGFP